MQLIIMIQIFIIISLLCSINTAPSSNRVIGLTGKPKLWITISAQTQSIEVSWNDGRVKSGDLILITNRDPQEFRKVTETASIILNNEEDGSGSGSGDDGLIVLQTSKEAPSYNVQWLCNNESNAIVSIVTPKEMSGWARTAVRFDYGLSRNVTIDTKCYGYWASYIDGTGEILNKACIQAYPKWMNEMKSAIADFRIRDIFIPGTHDSGSYRVGFDPLKRETLVTKYSLTQDDNIRGQLMHGARYIDLRIGFYRTSDDKFYVNHGITRQRPLKEVLEQIIDFVEETNEIVIIDIQEFPVGFGRNLDIHRFLVHFLKSKLEEYIIDPPISWQITLRDIWKRKKNIILSYDLL